MTEAENAAATAPDQAPSGTPLRRAVGRITRELESEGVSPGDRAALRRSRSGDLGGPAFWKLAARHLEPEGLLPHGDAPWRDEAERRWVTVVAAYAEMGAKDLRGPRLGKVLAEERVAEARVLGLLRASGVPLLRAARAVVHQLASRGAAFDARDLAELVTSDGAARAQSVRRRIARDYYRRLRREGQET